ncbi:MAG: LruC domain-containing protein [bacterium]
MKNRFFSPGLALACSFFLGTMLLIPVSSCRKLSPADPNQPKTIDDLVIASSFTWATTREISISILARDNMNNPLTNIRINVYTESPDSGGVYICGGVTDASGLWSVVQAIPAYLAEVTVTNDFLGLIREMKLPVVGNSVNGTFGGLSPNPVHTKSSSQVMAIGATKWVIPGFNAQGVPNNLEPINDPVDQSLLNDLNATLPEYKSVPQYHPEYLASTVPNNLVLDEQCDVWITYITEGAGWTNSLGYFVFNTNNPPASAAAIDTIRVVFPNLSNTGSGGALNPGNKVYLGRFPAGKSIGWVVVPHGWNGSGVYVGSYVIYSIPSFNPEPDANLKKHMLILRDATRLQFLYSFEDMRRDQGADQDFNDGVLYVRANPVSAVNTTGMPVITTTQTDTDKDGIPDNTDDYPNDATKAFNNYTPGKTTYSSLAFEDLWPGKGDYDMNDLVISYQFNQVTNASNMVVQVKATIITEAMGATLHNAFGFQLPIAPALVSGVTGIDLKHSLITLSANNTEAGQTKAVIIPYDDAFDRLPPPNSGTGSNTVPGAPFVTPDTMRLVINLAQPVSLSTMGIPPYNPFIIVNGNRNREVHLPDMPPTDKVDGSDFQTAMDDSQPASGRYYKTKTNLPWAINIAEKFNYPVEQAVIVDAYLKFGTWAESSGGSFNDWYRALSGYRNNVYIYSHP